MLERERRDNRKRYGVKDVSDVFTVRRLWRYIVVEPWTGATTNRIWCVRC